jgi:hypothetical protein
MASHKNVFLGGIMGAVTALLVSVAVVVAWPGAGPTVPPKPTAVILPADSPTPIPVLSFPATTPTPYQSIGAFGGE